MSKTTKSTKSRKPAAKKATKPAMTPEQKEAATITKAEAKLLAKYGDKIVKGSVRRAPAGSKYGQKLLCDINTRGVDGKFDGNTRTVATSDVFQVHHTEEVAAELKRQAAAERRAAAKARREASKPASVEDAATKLGV